METVVVLFPALLHILSEIHSHHMREDNELIDSKVHKTFVVRLRYKLVFEIYAIAYKRLPVLHEIPFCFVMIIIPIEMIDIAGLKMGVMIY